MPSEDEIHEVVQNAADRLVRSLDECATRLASGGDDMQRTVSSVVDECLRELSRLNLWGPANRLPSSELWNIAGRQLARGWLLTRAREKPRGYAGDYELLARMYLDQSCADPLGRLLDRYFLREQAPLAVRHRMQMMADWIVEKSANDPTSPLKVAVFGSAFGLEIREALLRLDGVARGHVEVVLLDLDPAAVEFARGQLAPLLPAERLTALATNLFRLPQRPAAAESLFGTDLIFCPGLFDYLEDAAACEMLQFLHAQLAPGGALSVFQFAPHCSSRALMEWIGNWYLLYRDETEFRRLVASAGFDPASAHFSAEPLGVDLCVTIG